MRTWEGCDPDLGRPIAAPLEQCAELLGVELATVREIAANAEPTSDRTALRSGV
jgi:plasmid maintenance system antidote protein VapI